MVIRAGRRGGPSHRPGAGLLLAAAWGALLVNGIAFGGSGLLGIPEKVGQLVVQGSLLLALLLALAANPRGLLRPNLFLVLLTILAVLGLIVSLHNDFFVSSTYRAVRFLLFVGVLWLLTPWWGRRDMLMLRYHRRVLWVVLGTVFLGAAVAPGAAFANQGRLSGVLWVIPATQVAHFGAILFGTSAVLWLCRVIDNRRAAVGLLISGSVIVATHTRTAVVATVIGLAVASASLFLGHVRVRRVTAVIAATTVVAAMLFGSGLTGWALRGQTTQEARELTGRTPVWAAVFADDRTRVEQLVGSGMSDGSFNGLPTDSSWVSKYVDQGWIGVFILSTVVILLVMAAATRERGPHRAAALFLIVYCVVASITEVGIGAATPYQLDLVIAAALLAPSMPGRV